MSEHERSDAARAPQAREAVRPGNSRRALLAAGTAALAGVLLAPGIRLIEIAAAQARDPPASPLR
ncbi:MAG: hypothetical protein EHM83_16420, partial [Burkholderiales bacterium]